MGACYVSGTFVTHDYRVGMQEVQDECRRYYGDDPYNGTISTCYNIKYCGEVKKPIKTKEELSAFINSRYPYIDKWAGEIHRLDLVGYRIFTTKIEETYRTPFDTRGYFKAYVNRGPAGLFGIRNGRIECLSQGTVAELKQVAHKYMRRNNYANEYYIISRNKSYHVYGDCKEQKTTTRQSNDKVLVLQVHRYVYIGLAAE